MTTICLLAVWMRAATVQTDAQERAVAATRAEAERGDADAQYRLGRMYLEGEGMPQDDAQAVEWFRKSAEQGNAKGQNAMGVVYDAGRGGVPEDIAQALAWFRKAAEQGEMRAQANLGQMYEFGRGVPQDYAQAAALYRKAAEKGFAAAQYNLGSLYVRGQGVPEDYGQAAVLYRRSAEQGFARAQYSLGLTYANGYGISRDDVEALKWLFIAASEASGDDLQLYAGGLDKIAKTMEPVQVEEAKRRALEWTETFKRQRAAQAQADAEPKPSALQLTGLTITPRTVRPGQMLSLEIVYTATDPAAASGKAAVTMSFSILSGGSTLLDVPGQIRESPNGEPQKAAWPVKAAPAPGAYLIRVRLAVGATVVTRDVDFEITQ